MLKVPDSGRGLIRCLGLAAAAMLALSAAPGQRADALSLISPTAVPAAKVAADGLTTEVVGRGGGGGGGGGFHGGGGGGFHGGGFRSGGAVSHGGGFGARPVFHGGGFRHGGFDFRHHRFHRHFFYGSYYPYYYYDYPYYYPHRRCRIVWTYYGPRRICHYRHWRHYYYW